MSQCFNVKRERERERGKTFCADCFGQVGETKHAKEIGITFCQSRHEEI